MAYRKPLVGFVSLVFISLFHAVASFAHAQPGYGYGGYGPGGHMFGGGWGAGWHGMFFGPLMMLLFLAIATVIVVLIVRWVWGAGKGPHHSPPTHKTPLDILKERFARGEIDAQEFEERRKILEQ